MESLDEKQIKEIEHHKAYHAKMKRAFGKNIKIEEFKVGELVLKKILTRKLQMMK